MDAIAELKENAKKSWAGFAALEMSTSRVAPALVEFSGIAAGERVLDVACGTGVVALTAARLGARVTGIDLTPELVRRAHENAAIMGLETDFHEGDAEALDLPDASFDVVVSQFGHMFAPRPEVAIREMLRVLRPGGRIAFSTWPPELLVGRLFALLAKWGPPAPAGASPSPQWGDPPIVRERLGAAVRDLCFARDTMTIPILSVPHYREFMERSLGPLGRLVGALAASDPAQLSSLRAELEALAAPYFGANEIRQGFLLTRATKI